MKLTKKYEIEWVEEAEMIFEAINPSDKSFAFPCDRNGNVIMSKLSGEARKNLENCKLNFSAYRFEIMDLSRLVHYPGKGICDCCNAEVEIFQGVISACYSCGQEYDENGNAMESRELWGEEANESHVDLCQMAS